MKRLIELLETTKQYEIVCQNCMEEVLNGNSNFSQEDVHFMTLQVILNTLDDKDRELQKLYFERNVLNTANGAQEQLVEYLREKISDLEKQLRLK